MNFGGGLSLEVRGSWSVPHRVLPRSNLGESHSLLGKDPDHGREVRCSNELRIGAIPKGSCNITIM
jgi:hypothetical protein